MNKYEYTELLKPDTSNLKAWLSSIGLPNLTKTFSLYIDGMDELKNIDAEDLMEYGIPNKYLSYLNNAIENLAL